MKSGWQGARNGEAPLNGWGCFRGQGFGELCVLDGEGMLCEVTGTGQRGPRGTLGAATSLALILTELLTGATQPSLPRPPSSLSPERSRPELQK